MNKLFKRIAVAFVGMAMAIGVGVAVGKGEVREAKGAVTYQQTALKAGKLLITTTYNGSTKHYLPTTTSSGAAPSAPTFTNVNDISADHLWNVTASGTGWKFSNEDGDYLFISGNDNNRVRISSSGADSVWELQNDGSLKDSSLTRYLGVYNGADWRSYNAAGHSNYKGSGTSLVFYEASGQSTDPVPVTGIELDRTATNIDVDEVITLKATVKPGSADVKTVTWSSSDPTIASVDDSGKVTGHAIGSATITATTTEANNDAHGDCVVNVKERNYGSLSQPLTVSEAKALLDDVGNKIVTNKKMYVKGIVGASDAEAADKDFRNIWLQSEDGNTAKAFELYSAQLDSSITGIGKEQDALKGLEVVAYGWGELYNTTYELTNKARGSNDFDNPQVLSAVNPSAQTKTLADIALSGTYQTEFYVGDTFNHDGLVVTASYVESYNDPEDVTSQATVTAPDMTTAGQNKVVTVSYKLDDVTKEKTYTINVNELPPQDKPATSLVLSATELAFEVGDEAKTLTATVEPTDTTDTLSWSVEPATGVVELSGTGNTKTVTPVATDNATAVITATIGNLSKTCNVTITKTVTPPAGHAGTVDDPKTVAEAIEIAQASGSSQDGEKFYFVGTVTQAATQYGSSSGDLKNIKISDPNSNNEILIYWLKKTMDGSSTWSAIDDVKVGDVLVIYGNPYLYQNNPQFGSSTQAYSLNGVPTASTPVVTYYTVHFNGNGAAGGSMADVTDATSPYTLPACGFTAPNGKHFAGWALSATGSVITTQTIELTGETTLYAIWEDDQVTPPGPTTYVVHFNGNGAAGGSMADVTDATSPYTLPTCGFTAPDGKHFAGWALSANGEVITTQTIELNGETTLYAIWEDDQVTPPTQTFTVSFNNNGGTGSKSPISNVSGDYILPANPFTAPSGKKFAGWKVNNQGDLLQPGAKINVSADVTLYAQWKDVPTLVSVEVIAPSKTDYFVGDNPDYAGLRVILHYSDQTTEELTDLSAIVASLKVNMDRPGEKTVTFTYQGINGSFKINVTRNPDVHDGCHCSVIAGSALLSITTLLGAGLLMLRKRKED